MLNTALQRLDARRRDGRPLRVGIIGLGSFGRMVLTQLDQISGIQIVAIADADPLAVVEAVDEADVRRPGLITDEVDVLIGARPDVVVEATGVPVSGIAHAAAAIDAGCHVVMANSAADALAGPELARRARAAGVVYSLARGDRPGLICDLVTWARASGFEVMSAGRGAVHRRGYQSRTPDTVWELFDYTEDEIRERGYNPRNFTSLVDGTQSAIEMASVANACGLVPQTRGLLYPPCGADRLAEVLVPQSVGGVLERPGTVEVVSALQRDGAVVENDLRYEVYVTLSAPNGYVARMFRNYGLATDTSGRFASVHRPVQMLGLETPVSVISAGVLGQDTGAPISLVAEVAAIAKRDLAAGEKLDGIGGYTVYGRLMPANEAAVKRVLPIGLAHGRRLLRPMPAGSLISYDDVDGGAFPSEVVALRPRMLLAPREDEHLVRNERITWSAAARAGALVDPGEIALTGGAVAITSGPESTRRFDPRRGEGSLNGADVVDPPTTVSGDDASADDEGSRNESNGAGADERRDGREPSPTTGADRDATVSVDGTDDARDGTDVGVVPQATIDHDDVSESESRVVVSDDTSGLASGDPDSSDDAPAPDDASSSIGDEEFMRSLQALNDAGDADQDEIDALLSDLASPDDGAGDGDATPVVRGGAVRRGYISIPDVAGTPTVTESPRDTVDEDDDSHVHAEGR